MGLSVDKLHAAGGWSGAACAWGSGWGYRFVGMSVFEEERFCAVCDSRESETTTRSTKIAVPPSRSCRRLLSRRRRAPQRKRRSSDSFIGPYRCVWLRFETVWAGLISERRTRETSACDSVERHFRSRHSEVPSEDLRHLFHQMYCNWDAACRSDFKFGKSRPNTFQVVCDTTKTSDLKSCKEISYNRRFRLMCATRMLSNLCSLLRSGNWNSSTSVCECKLCGALGLILNRCFRDRDQSVHAKARSAEVIRKRTTSTEWDSVTEDFGELSVESRSVRPKVEQSVPQETIPDVKRQSPTWDSLPDDVQANVLQRVDFIDLFRFKTTSKSGKKFIESDAFRQSWGEVSEDGFSAINYYIKNNSWRCSAYDLHSKSWKALPPFSYLPLPDAELFKEYSVCGHGGLMCAEVSKLPSKGELVVFNPLTEQRKELPPLLHPRNPVLVHLSVDSDNNSYKVIVAGSSAASDEHLSKKVEVFNSSTSKWKEVCDLPGPAFGLNEHQAGLCLNGKLFFVSFLESGGRGVVAFDLEEEKWLPDLTVSIPWSSYSNTLQLVENDGKLFVFSEQEVNQSVNHCIDELQFANLEVRSLTCRWRSVVKTKKSGGRGLQVYPEHICVGFGGGKVCIFNTLSRDGVVYDVRNGEKCEDVTPPPANQMGDNFFSLNPATFTLQPSFAIEC